MRRRPVAPDPRTFSRFYAASRRAGLQLAKYVLCPFGLAHDSVGNIIVDHTIALAQGHPDGNLYLCPLTGKPQPTASVACYYADCIAYEHDIPVIVLPTRGDFERFGYRYAHSGRTTPEVVHVANLKNERTSSTYTFPALSAKRLVKESYGESLCSILEGVRTRTNCRNKEGISSSLLGVRLSQSSYQYTGLQERWVCIKGVQGHRSRSEGPLCESAEGTKETERPAPVFVPRLATSVVT